MLHYFVRYRDTILMRLFVFRQQDVEPVKDAMLLRIAGKCEANANARLKERLNGSSKAR
jgi:hypothetical protein